MRAMYSLLVEDLGKPHFESRRKTTMLIHHWNWKRFFENGARCIALLLVCQGLYGQVKEKPRDKAYANQLPELSELAQNNLDHVAASAVQIREVLVKDAGLLVELKRWIAKEATDNGQIVEDSKLVDEAVFDRLNRDVAFRAVATSLLQRYGYLMASKNPDSSSGKEEDLLLKERARRLVQIEAQEDTESLQPQKNNQDVERTGTASTRSNRPTPNGTPVLDENPGPFPDGSPSFPSNPSRTLRTEVQEPAQRDRMSSPKIELASDSLKSGPDISPSQSSVASISGGLMVARDEASYADRSNTREAATSRPKAHEYEEEDVTPVKMVRRANPYADIPSLYDMYIQAAAWQRPAQRFGMDVFRNTINRPDAIPMDLPVGPDYVVGTGDSLAINLWGSTSQRLVRVVDREGRVSLPEIGSLLVSGRSLGDVQLAVQRALRTQFTDISADVSLSRLRTVRVYVVGDVAEPGAYDVSSLSTPLNALFAAGGITGRGSLRAIKHYRGKQLVQEVDAYDL